MEDIKISVICLAFNHEKYIRKCLEGFVMQKTNFKFEVIVHDDASTDRTREIIKEYEKKYPDIFNVIYQTENQHSRKVGIFDTFIVPKINGKYIAMCEGDDYWTDENKLQLQYDVMENNDVSLCVHRVEVVNEDESPKGMSYPVSKVEEGIITSSDFLRICERYNFQTTSYMYKTEDILKYSKEKPAFKQAAGVGDEPKLLYFAYLGNVYYIEKSMSCYRRNSVSSWTRSSINDIEKKRSHFKKMIDMLEKFNEYSENRYSDVINHRILSQKFNLAFIEEDYKYLIKKENREFFKRQTKKSKIKIILGATVPFILKKRGK